MIEKLKKKKKEENELEGEMGADGGRMGAKWGMEGRNKAKPEELGMRRHREYRYIVYCLV